MKTSPLLWNRWCSWMWIDCLQFDCCTFNLPGPIDSKHSSPVGNCGRKLMLGLFKCIIPCFFVISYSWPGLKFDTFHHLSKDTCFLRSSQWSRLVWLFYPCQWGPVVFVPSSRDRISCFSEAENTIKTSLGVKRYICHMSLPGLQSLNLLHSITNNIYQYCMVSIVCVFHSRLFFQVSGPCHVGFLMFGV